MKASRCLRGVAVVLSLLTVIAVCAQEVTFEGKTLTQWVAELRDGDWEQRIMAAWALGEIGPEAAPAVPALIEAVGDEDMSVRMYAAHALGAIGQATEAVIAALQQAANDPDDVVRTQAQWALDRIGAVPAAPQPERPEAQRPEAERPEGERPEGERPEPGRPGSPGHEGTAPRSAPDEGLGGPAFREAGLTEDGLIDAPVPPAAPDAPETPRIQEPVQGGKTFSEWVSQLDSEDVGERREACIALGEMEEAGRLAVGPLNRLRLYDEHENVQRQAALALCKILGVALGDILPKPRGPGEGTQVAEAGPVPQGRLFYLEGLHDVSEDGLLPNLDYTREFRGDGFTHSLHANLFYLDIAEAHKYRQDAAARGLDTSKRLMEVLAADDEQGSRQIIGTAETATSAADRMLKQYPGDYVLRASCNQQTRYTYSRWEDGWIYWQGGGDFTGLSPGEYDVEYVVWTQDGFRLEFKVPYRFAVELADDDEVIDISTAQDIAKEARQDLAALDPNDPDDRGGRLVAECRIAYEERCILSKLRKLKPWLPNRFLEFVRDAFTHQQAGHALGAKYITGDLHPLVPECQAVGTVEAYTLAHEIVRFMERSVAEREADPDFPASAREYMNCAWAYRSLGELAITCRMDITACLNHNQRSLAYEEMARKKDSSIAASYTFLKWSELEPQLPRPGWWNPSADELQPSLVVSLPGGGGQGGEGEGGQGDQAAAATSGEGKEKLDEAVAEYDEQRSEDLTWIVGNEERYQQATSRLGEAIGRLYANAKSLAETKAKIARLERILADSAVDMADESWSTEQLSVFYQPDARIIKDLLGDSTGGVEALKAKLRGLIADLVKQQAADEMKRDQIIQDTLLDFQSVAQSLEERGPACKDWDIRARADVLAQEATTTQRRVRMLLYAASGQEKKFREAGREVIGLDLDYHYTVRMLECAVMGRKGQVSAALMAARMALAANNEDTRGEQVKVRGDDGKEKTIWQHTPASFAVKKLELQLLSAIYGKTHAQATAIRKLGYAALAGRGEKTTWGTLTDAGAIADGIDAAGEDHPFRPLGEIMFMSTDVVKGVVKFMSGGWVEMTSEEGAIKAIGDFLEWREGVEERLRDSIPESWPGSRAPDEEDERGGLYMSRAREMGVVLDDASRTCVGVMLIAQLRARDVPLSQIRTMDRAEFKRIVAEKFKGHQLSDKRAMKLWGELRYAMQQPDVRRLLEGKKQVLEADAGQAGAEFSASFESLAPTVRDAIMHQINAGNLALVLLPNLTWGKGGPSQGFFRWAHPTGAAARDAVVLKQWVARSVGWPKVFQWMAKHETGRRLLADYAGTTARMGLAGRIGLDAILQMNAVLWSKYATEYAVGLFPTSEATQRKAGEVVEMAVAVATAFGPPDVDVTRALSQQALLNRSQAIAASRALRSALAASDQMAGLGQANRKLLRSLRPELEAAGALSTDGQRLAKAAADELGQQLDLLRDGLPPPQHAHPLVNRYYDQLAAVHASLKAASEGMPVEARTFSGMADRVAGRLNEGRNALVQQIKAVNEVAGGAAPGTPIRHELGEPKWLDDDALDFRRASAIPIADELYLRGRWREAARLYEAGWCLYDEFGMAADKSAEVIARRWRAARRLQVAQEYFAAAQAGPDPNVGVDNPITPAALARIRNAPDLRLEPIEAGVSELYMVYLGGKPVGVFKRPLNPSALRAELAIPRFGESAGLRIPAAAKTRMPLPAPGEVEGTFTLFKAADDATGPASDWQRFVRSPDTELVPVATGGTPAHWVLHKGKRVGLFMPDGAGVSDPADALSKIAREAGGETLGGAADKVPMRVPKPEVEGVFVRYVEGVDLKDLLPAQQIALKRQVAQGWAYRLVFGDWDGHWGNFKVAPNGDVAHFDWNIADILAENEAVLQRVLGPGRTTLSTDPAQLREDILKLMRYRLAIMTGKSPQSTELYRQLRHVQQYMTQDDFADVVRKMKAMAKEPGFIEAQLRNVYGDKTELAAKIIRLRIDCLEEVLDTFPALPAAPAPSGTASLPRLPQPVFVLPAAA